LNSLGKTKNLHKMNFQNKENKLPGSINIYEGQKKGMMCINI